MMSEENKVKLTPAEALDHLKVVFPSITGISIAGGTLTAVREHACDFQFSAHAANIDWGESTSYSIKKWRPATIEDLSKAVISPISCRVTAGKNPTVHGLLLIGGFRKQSQPPSPYVIDEMGNGLFFTLDELEVIDGNV